MNPTTLRRISLFSIWCAAAMATWPKGTEPFARATLLPKSGSDVTGTVDFAKTPRGLLIRVYASGLGAGKHGFHIHENGDCSAADAASAGAHFNPSAEGHAGPDAKAHHFGDFGNIVADRNGSSQTEVTIKNPSSNRFKSWNEIVGKSIVIHEKADDLKTQPAGDSGKRIACGVIQGSSRQDVLR